MNNNEQQNHRIFFAYILSCKYKFVKYILSQAILTARYLYDIVVLRYIMHVETEEK